MFVNTEKSFGRYEIRSLLGKGGMGEVYLAHDTQLCRPVALKVISPGFVRDENRLRRFRQEALATSALNHPNIITIHEIGSEDDVEFIATEFIDGITLRQRLARETLNIDEVLDLGSQIASALAAAHAAGIIHRDIKPDNIMIRHDGYVKVLDFGIAKLTENALRPTDNSQDATKILTATNPGILLGTVSYMSPEQARGLPLEVTTDIWSLGVVLYEMLTGQVPFRGKTMSDTIVAILSAQLPPLADADLQKILTKALQKQAGDRYQTIDGLLVDLKSLKLEREFRSKLEHAAQSDHQSVATVTDPHKSPVGSRPHNLPAQMTSLVGREIEANTIKDLFRIKNARLVTLIGPGGSGKTRLGLEIGNEMLSDFKDGVFYVSLASVSDPNLVPSAIAKTLNVKERFDEPVFATLKDYLCNRQLLLLLDNFEQIVSAAPFVGELLGAAPYVKILVTSRAVLHLSGEHQFPVPPLIVPDIKAMPTVDLLEQFSAVALFSQRARAVRPDFSITEKNARTVVEICRKLEGLPLAIELAAARIKLFPPHALLARLNERLKLLTGGAQDLPQRQQTMRRTIAWSYDLLDDEEKKIFRRISVFVDGCTPEAAEAVCNAKNELSADFLDVTASLVDKSLLRQQEDLEGQVRFRAFETIREYGLECLSTSGEGADVRQQHAGYFLGFAEQIEAKLSESDQELWLDVLEAEHDNLRCALEWSANSADVETGLRLAGALWRFWATRGYLAEGRERLMRLLALRVIRKSTKARMKALYAAGVLSEAQGDYSAARCLFEENLSLQRESNDKWGVANSLNNLGIIAVRDGDYRTAQSLYEESLNLWRELENRRAVALSLSNLGNVLENLGDDVSANQRYQESLAIFRELKDSRGIASSLVHLADASRRNREYLTARSLFEEALSLFMESGSKWDIASVLADLGSLACEQGDCFTSRYLYEESMVLFGELGDIRGVARLFEGFMALAIVQDQTERALRLAGAANALRREHGVPLPPDEQSRLARSLEPIRRALPETSKEIAWNSGAAMSIEQAIHYALTPDAG